MGWNLIKSIQKGTDLRLIVPFGLNLRLGDVISVNAGSGDFTLQGTSSSVLDVPMGDVRPPQGSGVNYFGSRAATRPFNLEPRVRRPLSTSRLDSADAWILGDD